MPNKLPVNRPGAVLWFTGLSGAGKTTLAQALYAHCQALRPTELLDGDAIREVFPQTGFSPAERDAHIRRVGFLASRLEHHGVLVIASLISPYRASRDFARSLCRRFVEIHVETPLPVCEARDVKGLYARARSGQIKDFTGLDAPYEAPLSPEIRLDTAGNPLEASLAELLEALRRLEIL